MKEYKIDLIPSKCDSFEEKNDNMMAVEVLDDEGNTIDAKKIRVQIFFTKNGMLGFGTELIRRAVNGRIDTDHWHVDPTVKRNIDNSCQEMGVFLHPDSPEVIICRSEFGGLESLLGQ